MFPLLENDKEKLAEAVHRTMVSVDKFINYTHSDVPAKKVLLIGDMLGKDV